MFKKPQKTILQKFKIHMIMAKSRFVSFFFHLLSPSKKYIKSQQGEKNGDKMEEEFEDGKQ